MTARLLDPKKRGARRFPFEYTPSAKTDVAKTFARVRREQAERKPAPQVVTPIRKVGP